MIEKSFAAIVLAVCVLALLRMLLRPRQRARVDRMLQRAWWWCRDAVARLRRRPRVSAADAQREAREAIERAARRKKNLH
jgi:Tfp pilus assembly protein PilV